MAEDGSGKRRRGRKRGRGQRPPHSERPQDEVSDSEDDDEPEDETVDGSEDSDGSGRRFGLPFGGKKGDEAEDDEEPAKRRERAAARTGATQASPMDFWRRGQARPYREAADRQRQMGLWKRITGLYFPPWVPVVGIIVIVFGILGLLFFLRSNTGAPHIGKDHWHATYEYIVCGVKQPNFPTWSAGVHTHGDGYIHIHPHTPSEEGSGARLVKWFQYGGGLLDGDSVRAPGSADEHKNGDECPDGQEAFVQVFANGQKLDNYTKYIPQNGDEVQIIFGPEQEQAAQTGNFIPDSEATREIEVALGDSGNPTSDATVSPTELEMETGEAVKLVLTYTGQTSLALAVAGPDNIFGNEDDFVSDPVTPGEQGSMVVRFNDKGEYDFRLANFVDRGHGRIKVTGESVQPINLTITDDGTPSTATFDPASIDVLVDKAVRLVVKNDGQLTHGITIPGADGTFGTEDDINTNPGIINPGESGVLSFVPNEVGEITLRDVQDVDGTLVVSETVAEPSGSATPAPTGEPVDVELEIGATNDAFDPVTLSVDAGQKFRITVTSNDEFIHNLRITGPDGKFNTSDDLTTTEDAMAGGTATLVGQIDDPGTYEFRDDFHTEVTGTLTVK